MEVYVQGMNSLKCEVLHQKKGENAEIKELSGLKPVSLDIKRSRLGQFGHVECSLRMTTTGSKSV